MQSLRTSYRASTDMARGEALPTLTKTKGFRALLLVADSLSGPGGPKPGQIYETPIENIRDLLSCRNDQVLKEEIDGLSAIKVNWAKIRPDEEGYTIPVSSCVVNRKTGMIRWAFDPQFITAWADNSLGFRRVKWEILVSFNSNYAAKLYEYLCVSYDPARLVHTKRIQLAELRELFGVAAGAYVTCPGRFIQEVVKATKNVNAAQSGFRVTHARSGRGKTSWHWFEIEPCPEQLRLPATDGAVVRSGETLRARIEKALGSLPVEHRQQIDAALQTEGYMALPAPDDLNTLRGYAGRLRAYGVELPPA